MLWSLSMPATGAGRGGNAWNTAFMKKIGQEYFLGPYLGCESTLCLFQQLVHFQPFFIQGGRLCYRRFDNTVWIHLPQIGPTVCVPFIFIC